jgi:hypothetical protein
MIAFFLQLCVVCLGFASPILFTYLYAYFYDEALPIWVGILYAVGILVANLLQTFFQSYYKTVCHFFEMRVSLSRFQILSSI